ncbi:family 1 glycosylhydrolase, partial [Rhizobium leguminosarum]|uniref:family 1 glycosylhydrolase n=1 Tax=Rhizobium leguminosarum TaxID=384 RepID=UPI003F9CB665
MNRLGDRLDRVATFNEPCCIVWLSHLYCIHAPGDRNMQAALHAMHYMNLAHGLGVEAIPVVERREGLDATRLAAVDQP